jgi:hypothetical protein
VADQCWDWEKYSMMVELPRSDCLLTVINLSLSVNLHG